MRLLYISSSSFKEKLNCDKYSIVVYFSVYHIRYFAIHTQGAQFPSVFSLDSKKGNASREKKYFQKWNCAASFLISTFMYVYLYPYLQQNRWSVDRSWQYINRSQILEYGNWERGRAVLFLETHKSDLLCSVRGPVLYIFLDSSYSVESHREKFTWRLNIWIRIWRKIWVN